MVPDVHHPDLESAKRRRGLGVRFRSSDPPQDFASWYVIATEPGVHYGWLTGFRRHAGYSSTAANTFLENLRDNAGRDWKVHARALGSIAYVMTSQTSTRETVAHMEAVVLGAL